MFRTKKVEDKNRSLLFKHINYRKLLINKVRLCLAQTQINCRSIQQISVVFQII
jgi:hypothetical protein